MLGARAIRFLIRAFIGLTAVFIVIATTLFWFADPLQIRAPSDHALTTLFQDHQAEFERLRQMATEDAHTHNLSYFSDSTIGQASSNARIDEYKRLLGLKAGLTASVDYDGNVRFLMAGGGLSAIGPGWAKGLQYIPSGARLIGEEVATLDDERHLPEGVYLRAIAPGWYIFFQRDD